LLTAFGVVAALACTGCATGITGPPTTIAEDGAVVSGKVINDVGVQIEYWAEYGPTDAYGFETDHEQITTGDYELQTVFPRIQGLQRSTTYHYRICAQDSEQVGGPSCGQDARFTTQRVGCGETVTEDVKLTGDLDCPLLTGFVIGADGVDVNLGGHSMLGGVGVGGGGPRAIDNAGGFDDLTVRNGALTAFGYGVHIEGGARNRILDVQVGASGSAAIIDGGTQHEIRNSGMLGRSWGVRATSSDGLVIVGTSAEGAFGSGIDVVGDQARIVRNRVVRGGAPFGDPAGIEYTGSGARLAGNLVEGAWNGGIVATGSDIALVDNVVRNTRFPPTGQPAFAGDGIFVGAFSARTLLRGNRTEGNEGDGIEVQATGTRFEGNAAFDNGDFGIDAAAPAIDLGGNTAGENGNPQQCRNIFCP
jgi:hypothetical protein